MPSHEKKTYSRLSVPASGFRAAERVLDAMLDTLVASGVRTPEQ